MLSEYVVCDEFHFLLHNGDISLIVSYHLFVICQAYEFYRLLCGAHETGGIFTQLLSDVARTSISNITPKVNQSVKDISSSSKKGRGSSKKRLGEDDDDDEEEEEEEDNERDDDEDEDNDKGSGDGLSIIVYMHVDTNVF